jgi:hypothetical protein
MTRVWTVLSRALLGAVLLVAGCSSHAGSGGGTPARPAGPDPWQQVTGRVGADGRLDAPSALDAFALAVGPVPGATRPPGQITAIPSGTLAVASVFGHWADYNAGQHAAIRAALGAATARNAPAAYRLPTAPQPPAADPNVACLAADSAGAEPYRADLTAVEPEITARLGRPLTLPVHLAVNTKDLENALMYAWGCAGTKAAGGGKVTGCTIHINPKTVGGTFSPDEVRTFLIHELMHCYLYDSLGGAYDTMPDWYVEGAPTWVMEQLGVSTTRLGSIWQGYLDSASRPLGERAYDGLGFFVHLAETGTDVWKAIDPIGAAMLDGKGTPAGWAAAGVSASFLDSWGSGYAQGRYPGAPWTSGGPNLPPYQPAMANGRIGDGATLTVSSGPYATLLEQLDVDASVLLSTPAADTSGRLSLGGGTDSPLAGGPFCTIAHCACPSGTAGEGTTFTPLASGRQYLGLTGGPKAGSVVLTGMSLDDFCAKPSTPCVVGQWRSVAFDISAADGKVREQGGSGVRLHIDPQGHLTVQFNGMAPITFTIKTSGRATSGHFTFAGTETGQLVLPAATATSGRWIAAGMVNLSSITADMYLTSPIAFHLASLNLGALAGSKGGGAVGKPNLVAGSWTCSGDRLVSLPPPGSSVSGTWTLARAGKG